MYLKKDIHRKIFNSWFLLLIFLFITWLIVEHPNLVTVRVKGRRLCAMHKTVGKL